VEQNHDLTNRNRIARHARLWSNYLREVFFNQDLATSSDSDMAGSYQTAARANATRLSVWTLSWR